VSSSSLSSVQDHDIIILNDLNRWVVRKLDGLIINRVWSILNQNPNLRTTSSSGVWGSVGVRSTALLERPRVLPSSDYSREGEPTNIIWFLRWGLVAAFADGKPAATSCWGVSSSSSKAAFSLWPWHSRCWLYPGEVVLWFVLGVIWPSPCSESFFWEAWGATSSSSLGEESAITHCEMILFDDFTKYAYKINDLGDKWNIPRSLSY
jgi:hypothetical protein